MLTFLLWSLPVYAHTPYQVVEIKVETEVEEVPAKSEPLNVESYVKQYFKDTPVMVKIAQCESNFRQWDSQGNVLRGFVDNDDTGVMQINKRYHLKVSQRLGLDIATLEGNLAYAKFLYDQSGTQPWLASRACWNK